MTARIIIILLSTFLGLFLSSSFANAQIEGYGLGLPLINLVGEVEEGSMVCLSREGYKECDRNYDSSIAGVATLNPSSAISIENLESEFFLLTSGLVNVRVSGDINQGDLITSSDNQGVGQKAARNGYVLGTAAEDLAEGSDTVLVSIAIHPTVSFADTRSNLLELIREGLAAPVVTPLSALRYILAAMVTIVSFLLGFIYFGRLARSGVEAIGRNPLAHRTIELTVLLHIIITIAIFLAGLGIAYLILAL